jgi:hypothetical protein
MNMPDNTPIDSSSDPANVQVQAAPAVDNAPTVQNGPVPGPDLSALVQPGSSIVQNQPAPNVQTGALGSAQQSMEESNAYNKKAAELASAPPVAPPNVPHARLMNLISALSTGLSAASTSLATHGREGGAAEVVQIQGEQQRQKQAAVASAVAQKNAAVQTQLTAGETARANAQNYILLATMHDQVDASHFKVQEAQQGVIGQAQTIRTQALQDLEQTCDVPAYSDTLQKLGVASGATPGTPGAGPAVTIPPVVVARWKNSTDSAASAYPNDPQIQQYAATLTDPKSTPQQMALAANGAKNRMSALDAGTASRTKQEAAASGSPVAKLSTPEALAAPGAQAAIQAKIDDPTTDPKDVARFRALLPQAAVAQLNAETIKSREARNTQIVNQGNADDAGKALAARTLTLDELKSRSVTPAFIVEATKAAQKYDPNFKAPEAAAQARIAASPANSQFFGNTDSLLVKGGTLDQLTQAHAALGNTKLPFANKIENWRKAQLGQGPQAAFAANALGVADDYSKVISGGAGSDTSRQQALDIIGRNLSPEGMTAAINQIRKTITSQRNGRISTNPYLADMYPDPSTRQEIPGQAGTQPAAPHSHIFNSASWAKANPGKDVNAAISQAKAAGYQVKQ